MSEKLIPAPPRYRLLILDLLMVRGLSEKDVFEVVRLAFPKVDEKEIKEAIENASKIKREWIG